MIKETTIKMLALAVTIALSCSCSKSDDFPTPNDGEGNVCFGVRNLPKSRIAPDSQIFEKGDSIGLFGYFNWYYDANAEGALFKNYRLEIGDDDICDTGVKWSFSSHYGSDTRKVFDVAAYYPYDPNVHTNPSESYISFTAGALVYKYHPEYDFMVAVRSYSIWNAEYAKYNNFRDYLQSIDYIPLTFYRQMASVTISITKDVSVAGDIKVSGATFFLEGDVPSTLTFDNTTYTGKPEEVILGDNIAPEADGFVHFDYDFTNKYSDEELTITDHDITVEIDAFFPPGVDIFKVELDISGAGADGQTTHIWHPHLGKLDANENYTLNIIVEPGRIN